MNCVLCGLDEARPVLLTNGSDIGPAHLDCSGLVLLAHSWRGTPYEQSLMGWFWAQQAAHMRGEPFDAPSPKSPAELHLERLEIEAALGGSDGVLVVSH